MQLDICFCSDENLVDHIPVVINSILKKNSHHELTIYLIHNIEDVSKLDYLTKFCSENGVEFKTYLKKWEMGYNSPLKKTITEATMLRLFIPELIESERLLYLDIDLIVNTDLERIYSLDCGCLLYTSDAADD